jgi:hypothetical protein
LDGKTKDKAMEDEINNKYGAHKGSMGMIIRQINEPTTNFVTNTTTCKLLRKFCEEESFAASVIETPCSVQREVYLS